MSATVRFENSSQAHLYTQRADNGNWFSYGFTSNLVGHNDDGSSRCEVAESFQDYTEYSDSQTALDAAVYGFEEVPASRKDCRVEHFGPAGSAYIDIVECTSCGYWELVHDSQPLYTTYITRAGAIEAACAYLVGLDAIVEGGLPSDDEYTGDVLPTGWDAQDHKALYE